MNKIFKMGVISLGFLITGGVIVHCVKKHKTKKNEETNPLYEVKIDEYVCHLPVNEKITEVGNSSTYKLEEHYFLTMYSDEFLDDFDEIMESRVHSMMKESWLHNGKELSYSYNEGIGFKTSYYSTVYFFNNLTWFGQFITIIDKKKKKFYCFNFMLKECTEKKCEKAVENAFDFYRDFLKSNYLDSKTQKGE